VSETTKIVAEKIAKRLARGIRGPQPGQKRQGNYRRGHQKVGGRQRGVENALPALVKEAILQAFTELGSDNRGEGGLVGFIKRIGKKDLKTAGMLLRAILPLQVNTKVDVAPYRTLEEIDADLRAMGVRPLREIFEIDYVGTQFDDAEIIPPARAPAVLK
jgi:hypothetical protein